MAITFIKSALNSYYGFLLKRFRNRILPSSKKYAPLRMIGWNIALTENEPVILEMNTGTGVYSVQMGSEYGIAEDFKGYVPTFTK